MDDSENDFFMIIPHPEELNGKSHSEMMDYVDSYLSKRGYDPEWIYGTKILRSEEEVKEVTRSLKRRLTFKR